MPLAPTPTQDPLTTTTEEVSSAKRPRLHQQPLDLYRIHAFRGRVDLNGKNASLVEAGAERNLMRVVNTGELIRARTRNLYGPLTSDFGEVEALLDTVLDRLCEAERRAAAESRAAEKRIWVEMAILCAEGCAEREAERIRMQDPEYAAEKQRQEELREELERKEEEEMRCKEWLYEYIKWRDGPNTTETIEDYKDQYCGFEIDCPRGGENEYSPGFNPFWKRPAWVNWALVKSLYFKPWSAVNFITKQVGVNQGHLDGRVGMRYRQEAENDDMIGEPADVTDANSSW